MLADLRRLKLALNLSLADSSADERLGLFLAGADSAAKNWCKSNLETAVYTELYDGSGRPDLALRQAPVRIALLTGTLSSGSAVVTGLTGTRLPYRTTAGLIVGCPVVCAVSPQTLPDLTTILTVDSATQVTLSANATASGSTALVFGLATYADGTAYHGQAANAFDSASLLYLGSDYELRTDRPDGSSKCGLIRRIGLGGAPFDWPGTGYSQYGPRGTLTARAAASWPAWMGNIRVSYQAGWGVGAALGEDMPGDTTIPTDLSVAVAMLAVSMSRMATRGGYLLGSENYEDYGYSLLSTSTSPPEIGSVRQILSRYRSGLAI